VQVEARVADFRNLNPWRGRRFDAVICTGNSITLVPQWEGMARALKCMAKAARPAEGIVIVGLHNYLVPRRAGKAIVLRRAEPHLDPAEILFDVHRFGERRVEVDYLFLRRVSGRWRPRTYTKAYWLLEPEALAAAMTAAGLQGVGLLDISGQRPYSGEEWLLAVGHR